MPEAASRLRAKRLVKPGRCGCLGVVPDTRFVDSQHDPVDDARAEDGAG